MILGCWVNHGKTSSRTELYHIFSSLLGFNPPKPLRLGLGRATLEVISLGSHSYAHDLLTMSHEGTKAKADSLH